MPTTEQEKPTAKPRQRNRKADQRNPKGEQKKQALPEQVLADQAATDADSVSSNVAPIEATPIEAAPAPPDIAPAVVAEEPIPETALSGEVLPPETRELAPQMAGPFAVAQAYGEYTRKSWLAGRFLVERLIAVRTFDQAIEVQGEFTRFACANFLTQSQKVCEFYGACAGQFFRPYEKLVAEWPRVGR
jgi:hypothetical protein